MYAGVVGIRSSATLSIHICGKRMGELGAFTERLLYHKLQGPMHLVRAETDIVGVGDVVYT